MAAGTGQVESRQARRRRATADSLTGATLHLVAEEGTGVSVQAIADRADVALTTLYNHFDSKDALFRAAAVRSLFDFEADVNQRMGVITDPGERVVARTRLYLRMSQTHEETAKFLSRLSPEVTATRDLHSSVAEQEVLAAKEAGAITCANVQIAHMVVNATAMRFIAMALQDDSIAERDADELAGELMSFLGMPQSTVRRLISRPLPTV